MSIQMCIFSVTHGHTLALPVSSERVKNLYWTWEIFKEIRHVFGVWALNWSQRNSVCSSGAHLDRSDSSASVEPSCCCSTRSAQFSSFQPNLPPQFNVTGEFIKTACPSNSFLPVSRIKISLIMEYSQYSKLWLHSQLTEAIRLIEHLFETSTVHTEN